MRCAHTRAAGFHITSAYARHAITQASGKSGPQRGSDVLGPSKVCMEKDISSFIV